jgi:hypothetical protein
VASSWSTITLNGQLARKTFALEGSGCGCNSRPIMRMWLCVAAAGHRNLASTSSLHLSLRGGTRCTWSIDTTALQSYSGEAVFPEQVVYAAKWHDEGFGDGAAGGPNAFSLAATR